MINRVANKSALRERESALRDADPRISTALGVQSAMYKNNARKLLSRILSIVNNFGCSMRVVYEFRFIHSEYTTRMLQPSKFRILKIRESSARALFLYDCTPNISRSADASVSVA